MSITAIVENNTIKLPMHVPDGTRVEIVLPETPAAEPAAEQPNALAWMLKYAGVVDDLPADLAAEHDHYLYGIPKRGRNA